MRILSSFGIRYWLTWGARYRETLPYGPTHLGARASPPLVPLLYKYTCMHVPSKLSSKLSLCLTPLFDIALTDLSIGGGLGVARPLVHCFAGY